MVLREPEATMLATHHSELTYFSSVNSASEANSQAQ